VIPGVTGAGAVVIAAPRVSGHGTGGLTTSDEVTVVIEFGPSSMVSAALDDGPTVEVTIG
jgi:hypothetical protein